MSLQGLMPPQPSLHSRLALCHCQGAHQYGDDRIGCLIMQNSIEAGGFSRGIATSTVTSRAHMASAAEGVSWSVALYGDTVLLPMGHDARLSLRCPSYLGMCARSTGPVVAANGRGLAAAAEEDDYDADEGEGAPRLTALPCSSHRTIAILFV